MKKKWFDLTEAEKEEKLRLAAEPHMTATPMTIEAKRLLFEYLDEKVEVDGVMQFTNHLYLGDLGLTLEFVYRQHMNIKKRIDPQWGCMREGCMEWAGLKRPDPYSVKPGRVLYGHQTLRPWSEISILNRSMDMRKKLLNTLLEQPELN